MANITVKGGVPTTVAPAPDPFRQLMRNWLAWDPFAEMAPLMSWDERLTFVPSFDVKENRESYLFKADVPGVLEKDLDVNVSGNRLTVSGKRESEKEEKTDRSYSCERTFGSFTRSFTLPEGADVDKVKAELKDGVLSLMIPKKSEMQPKKIAVKT